MGRIVDRKENTVIKRNEAKVPVLLSREHCSIYICFGYARNELPEGHSHFFSTYSKFFFSYLLSDLRLTEYTIFWVKDATLWSGINIARCRSHCPILLPVAGNIAIWFLLKQKNRERALKEWGSGKKSLLETVYGKDRRRKNVSAVS